MKSIDIKGENSNAVCSVYNSRAHFGFSVIKVLNISGVPFNIEKSTQDGRIVGGTATTIENHPHQVQLLDCC